MRIQVHQFTSPVITLGEDNTFQDALFLMQKHGIKRIAIVHEDFPTGIVTERDLGRFLESDKTTRSMDEIPLNEVMSRSLVTISEDQSDIPIQCAIRMATFQISSVLVINENGKLAGIVTKADLAHNFGNLYPGVYKVKDYMSRKVMTCRKTDSLYFALDILNRNKISKIIVTDNSGRPVGIITYDSFLKISKYFKTQSKTRNYLLPESSANGITVGDIVGPELITVSSEDDLAKAAKLMTEYKVSGIPVMDKSDTLEGIITSTDIVTAYEQVETHFQLIKKDPHFA